jgi:hypothetical protein
MRIYLCGGIRKTEQERKVVWTEEDKNTIRRILGSVELIDPQRTPELTDPMIAFGCDLKDVRDSDALMVDMRQKRGIGVGAEMTVAKMLGKPVVAVAPRNSHYRRDRLDHFGEEIRNWTNPFIFGLSDKIAGSVEEAAEWIRELNGKRQKIKDISFVDDSIGYFERSGEERR